MQPFKIPLSLNTLSRAYPQKQKILKAIKDSRIPELNAIACLWLSEGIPFAFYNIPGLYEVLREWISKRLYVHSKEITLIGSGRLGLSLAPKKLGKIFANDSDLDWCVISESLFNNCKEEFALWVDDYKNEIVNPRNNTEKRYWDDNMNGGPRKINRGFIDPHMIPTWKRYPNSQLIGNTMWLIKAKCEITKGSPEFKKSTIRVYRNWIFFIKQVVLNLRLLQQKIPNKNF